MCGVPEDRGRWRHLGPWLFTCWGRGGMWPCPRPGDLMRPAPWPQVARTATESHGAELIVCCREPRRAVESLQIYPGVTESRSEPPGRRARILPARFPPRRRRVLEARGPNRDPPHPRPATLPPPPSFPCPPRCPLTLASPAGLRNLQGRVVVVVVVGRGGRGGRGEGRGGLEKGWLGAKFRSAMSL